MFARTEEPDFLQCLSMATHDLPPEPSDFLIEEIHCDDVTWRYWAKNIIRKYLP
jgi:hypothetical protein